MKAIILAAGEGKRMRPLTLEQPKGMIAILGKPLLHHIIDSLPTEITEVVLVIGYKGEQIEKYFGQNFSKRKITYVRQEKISGTAHALDLCHPLIGKGERFLLMVGDDLHSPAALKKLIQHPLGTLAHEHPEPSRFGVFEVDNQDRVIDFVEKPEKPKSNLVSPHVFVLDDRIFNYAPTMHRDGEFYTTSQISQLIRDHTMIVERSDFWHPVGYPHDVSSAEKVLCEQQKLTVKQRHDVPVIIIAGGKGTRLPPEEQHKPKCLVEIAGKPILEWQIEVLEKQGFTNIRLSLGHKAELVVAWLKEVGRENISYVIEKEPLGTGGGLRLATKDIKVPFIAFNCDDVADVDFSALVRHGANGKYNVISGVQFDAAFTFDSLVCDEHKRVCEFKQRSQEIGNAIVNIGHYYLLPSIFEGMPEVFSNERDLFPKLADQRSLVLHTHNGFWLTANSADQIKDARDFFSGVK